MTTEPKPIPEPEPIDGATATESAPDTKPDQPPEPDTSARREFEAASRSARYAMLAAVGAAIISSFVAAGAAVYVSINQSNSSERLAVAQAIRQDRQQVYSDFSVTMFSYMRQLGSLSGALQGGGSIESVEPEITELGAQQGEFLAGVNLLLMAGSPDMQEVVAQFAEAVFLFSRDQLAPFTAQYTAANAPRANDIAGWERDSAALVVAISDVTTKIGELNAAFIEQGVEDLR